MVQGDTFFGQLFLYGKGGLEVQIFLTFPNTFYLMTLQLLRRSMMILLHFQKTTPEFLLLMFKIPEWFLTGVDTGILGVKNVRNEK